VPERPIPEYKLPDEFLRYFAFKPGSYWVYKNKKNGMIDTVTVIDYKFGYHTLVSATDGKALYKYEDFGNVLISTAYQALYSINAQPIGPIIDKNTMNACYDLNLSSNGPWGGGASDRVMFFPMKHGESYDLWRSGGKTILKNQDTTLYIKSSKYDSVNLFYSDYSSIFHNSKVNLFFKKNIGIIRRTNLDNGDDWEMVDYKTYY